MNRERIREFVEEQKGIYEKRWVERLKPHYDKNGEKRYKKSPINIRKTLEYHPLLRGRVGYNELTASPCWIAEPPFRLSPSRENSLRKMGYLEVEETDLVDLKELFDGVWGWNVSLDDIQMYIKKIASKYTFHPIKEYLLSLTWDGESRLEGWTVKYLGAKDTRYNRLAGRYFLLSLVARGLKPGCKMDQIFILEGEQGRGKSTALKILAGEEWFTDTPVNLEWKDFFLESRGKWIIELAELDALLKSEPSLIKNRLSSSVDRFRPPYARKAIDVPRSFILTGTTNIYEYIKDPTGGRRFIPIRTGRIDLRGLEIVREQLLAEAVWRYFWGEEYYYPERGSEEEKLLKREQELRELEHPWEEAIKEFLLGKEETTTREILEYLGKELKEIKRRDQMAVGIILRKLGWQKKKSNGRTKYVKVRGTPGTTSDTFSGRGVPGLSPGVARESDTRDTYAPIYDVRTPAVLEFKSHLRGRRTNFLLEKVSLVSLYKKKQGVRAGTPGGTPERGIPWEIYSSRNYGQVRELQENGLFLIPLKGKHPLGKWKEERYRFDANRYEELLEDWRLGEREEYPNVGVACGRTRNNWHLVVIDVDREELGRELERKGLLPPTAKVRTSRGYHYYYKYYGEETRGRDLRSSLGLELEIKGEGQYVVGPPSIHESGLEYKWERPLSLMTELPEWAEKVMLEEVEVEGEEKNIELKEEERESREKIKEKPNPPPSLPNQVAPPSSSQNKPPRTVRLPPLHSQPRAAQNTMGGTKSREFVLSSSHR